MDTIYGMLIHDIPGNAINHDIFPSKINKGKKKQIMGPILSLYTFQNFKSLYSRARAIYVIAFFGGI